MSVNSEDFPPEDRPAEGLTPEGLSADSGFMLTGEAATREEPGAQGWDDETPNPAGQGGNKLYLALDGWEGPLDLLLDLARRQKVDLRQISILALVDQYLTYIERAGDLKLELAADYLVMAAWLAYLKSALLLPKEEQEDPSPEELALRLQLRLQRLGAMREAAARLMARDRIGRDIFLRGAPEGLRIDRKTLWKSDAYSLIQAYGQVKARTAPRIYHVADRPVMTLDSALDRVSAMLGVSLEWMEIRDFLPPHASAELRKSALASSFVAALELARTGRAELAQEGAFAPLRVRRLKEGSRA
ncbi:MAG: ScpA family protein [Pseudomonadota bacterium]